MGEVCLALQIAKNMVMYVCEHFRPGWIDIPNWPSLSLSVSFFHELAHFLAVVGDEAAVPAPAAAG